MKMNNKVNYVYIYDEEKNHTYISILFPNHEYEEELIYKKYTTKIIKKLETIATLLSSSNGNVKILFQTLSTNNSLLSYLENQIRKLNTSIDFIKLNCDIILITYKNHHTIEQDKLNLIKKSFINNQLTPA